MTRVTNWIPALNAVIERHSAMAPQWGVSDCWIMTTDAYLAMTGQALLEDLRNYKSEKGGYRLFAKAGFATVEEALASALPDVSILSAQRGDIGIVEREGGISCGVFTALGLAVRGVHGDGAGTIIGGTVDYLPVTHCYRAFKVV